MPEMTNAQVALMAAVRSTNPGMLGTDQSVLKSAQTYMGWLESHTAPETPDPEESNSLSRVEQAGVLKKASKIGLDGYVGTEGTPHVPELNLKSTLNLLKELHIEGYEISKRGGKK